MSETINCPFCHEGNFDLVGLKHHFEMGYCDIYNGTLSVDEESALSKLKKYPDRAYEDEVVYPSEGCDNYGSLDN